MALIGWDRQVITSCLLEYRTASRPDGKINSSKVLVLLEREKSIFSPAFMCYRGVMAFGLHTQVSYVVGILKVQKVMCRSFSALGKVVEN